MRYKQAVLLLREHLAAERNGAIVNTMSNDVQEKVLEPTLVAGIRMHGRYSDCGRAFGKLCRQARGAVAGPPMMLHFNDEYRENDADFEACIPLRKARQMPEAEVHTLAGGRCVTLLHTGPYEELGRSYARIFQYVKDKAYNVQLPSREVYLKGPGMIFRGNPKKYVTEIQMLVEEPGVSSDAN